MFKMWHWCGGTIYDQTDQMPCVGSRHMSLINYNIIARHCVALQDRNTHTHTTRIARIDSSISCGCARYNYHITYHRITLHHIT